MSHKAFQTYSQIIDILGNEWLFRYIHFSNGSRESQDSGNKLPKYCSHVTKNVKQSYLDCSNPFHCFHDVSKSPECNEHSVEAVQISSNDKGSIIDYRSGQGPRDHSQEKRHQVNYNSNDIQNIPSVTEIQPSKWVTTI